MRIVIAAGSDFPYPELEPALRQIPGKPAR
jgi:hypothetical protein